MDGEQMGENIIKGDNIHYPTETFYSALLAVASIVGGGGGDVQLPDVTVPPWLNGFVLRAEVIVMFNETLDTSAAPNGLNGDQYVQVQKSVAGAYINAMLLRNGMFPTPASAKGSGAILVGDTDIKAQVNGPGTYNIKILTGKAIGGNLELHTVQTGIRLFLFR